MNTKKLVPLLLAFYLSPAIGAEAIILNEEKEHIGGSIVGGSSFFLIGGALSGGPVGAIIGGLAGSFTGAAVQENTNQSGRAYKVQYADGKTEILRSPNYQFDSGETVAVLNNRPRPITE